MYVFIAIHSDSWPLLVWSFILSLWLMLRVSDKDRQTVFISLTVISLVGCFLFFLIRKPDPETVSSEASDGSLQVESTESFSTTRWVLSGFPWVLVNLEFCYCMSLSQSWKSPGKSLNSSNSPGENNELSLNSYSCMFRVLYQLFIKGQTAAGRQKTRQHQHVWRVERKSRKWHDKCHNSQLLPLCTCMFSEISRYKETVSRRNIHLVKVSNHNLSSASSCDAFRSLRCLCLFCRFSVRCIDTFVLPVVWGKISEAVRADS